MSIFTNEQLCRPWPATGAKWLEGAVGQYHATVARALCAASTWSYSTRFLDVISGLGFVDAEFAPLAVQNDALLMDHVASLIQSEDGTVIVVCFRGTPLFNPITWLGNFSVQVEPFHEAGKVHGGFQRALSVLFPWINELVVRAGLTTQTDYVESIDDALEDIQKREDAITTSRTELTHIERYTLLDRWLADPKRLVETAANKSVNDHAEGMHRAEIKARLVRMLLRPGCDRDCSRALLESERRIVDAKSFADEVLAMNVSEVGGILRSELQSILQGEVRRTIYGPIDQPKKSPVERIYFTGHSLGGGLAVLAAAELCRKHPKEMEAKLGGIYTFGQPMVGDHLFAERCQEYFRGRLFRHIFHNDVVPHWPPLSAGPFEHTGDEEYWATNNGWEARPSEVDQTWTMAWSVPVSLAAFAIKQIPLLSQLQEHPLINTLANWGPFQHSIFDDMPLNYLRTSYATRIGTEFSGSECCGAAP